MTKLRESPQGLSFAGNASLAFRGGAGITNESRLLLPLSLEVFREKIKIDMIKITEIKYYGGN